MSEDKTQAEIAETLGDGWSLSKVKNHSQIGNKIVTDVLDFARKRQSGRVTSQVTSVTFSEGWFRTSGLYDLNRDGVEKYAEADDDEPKHAQMRVMEWFIHDQNGDASKSAVKRKVEDVEAICEQLDQLEAELNPGVDDGEREELRDDIIAGTYTDDTLASAIKNANDPFPIVTLIIGVVVLQVFIPVVTDTIASSGIDGTVLQIAELLPLFSALLLLIAMAGPLMRRV